METAVQNTLLHDHLAAFTVLFDKRAVWRLWVMEAAIAVCIHRCDLTLCFVLLNGFTLCLCLYKRRSEGEGKQEHELFHTEMYLVKTRMRDRCRVSFI